MKIYDGNVNTNFHDKWIPKEKTSNKCLSIIMLDSVVRIKKKYYPQTLLKECKYEKKKKTEMENLIDDELEANSSDDEADIASDDDEKEYNE